MKADDIEVAANDNKNAIPPLTMGAGQNAANIAANSDEIEKLYPARVEMATANIDAA